MDEHRGRGRAAALHALVDAVARGDLVETGQLARQAIESALGCQQALILRYDPERQRFVATSLLNQGTRCAQQEVEVPAGECSCKEVLATRRTLRVPTPEVHSSAERQLLGDRDVVAFAFPVLWGIELLGVIYAPAQQDRELSEEEYSFAEEVAALVALALERARVSAKAAAAEQAAAQWRQRYAHLFGHVQEAVMVVDPAADLVYEANRAMATLLAYPPEELHAMRLSHLFWPGEMPDWRSLVARGPITTSCKLRGSDGQPREVRVEAAALGEQGEGRYILIAHTTEDRRAQEEGRPQAEAANLLTGLDESGDLEASVHGLFTWLGRALGAALGTLHQVSAQGQGIELKVLRSFVGQEEVSAEVASALAQGPYQQTLEAGTVVACSSVAASRDFAAFGQDAARAGYDAFIAAPLTLGPRQVGVLTYFFPQPRTFATEHRELFAHGARLLTFLLVWAEQHRGLERMASGAQTALDVVTGLARLRSPEKIAVQVASRLQECISFDLFSLTLFEQGGAQARALSLASPALAELMAPLFDWVAVPEAELGWLQPKAEGEGPRGQLALADKIGSRISVLLLANGTYIGNLSLGSLGEDAFTREDVRLLRMAAPAVAEALVACSEEPVTAGGQELRPAVAPEASGREGMRGEKPSRPDQGEVGTRAAEVRAALQQVDLYLRSHHAPDAALTAQWQAVREAVERFLSSAEAYEGAAQAEAEPEPEEEALQPLSLSRLLNEVTVALHRAGRLREVQLVVIPGPAMEILTRPALMTRALRELLDAVLSTVAGTPQPRVEVGYREQLLSKFIYLRYSGPVPDLSGMQAREELWRVFSERVRAVQQVVARCGGKLTARALPSGETELAVSFAKAAALGDG